MTGETDIPKKRVSVAEAVAEGCINLTPAESEIVVAPGRRYPRSVFLCVRPLRLGDARGGAWDHAVGDVLYASDALASGGGLQALVGRGDVVELDADTGLPALYSGLLQRVDRLERALALSDLSDAALFGLAVERGLVASPSGPAA